MSMPFGVSSSNRLVINNHWKRERRLHVVIAGNGNSPQEINPVNFHATKPKLFLLATPASCPKTLELILDDGEEANINKVASS